MDRNRWYGARTTLAASTMVFALLAATACEKKADETMAADTIKAAPAAPALPAATEIQTTQLQTGAAALKGQTVRVNGVTVVSTLGTQAFWISLPNKNPFLVMTNSATTVKPQDMLDVVGTVTVMNDSILKAWVTSGAITDNQKLEAEFATEFIQAQAMQPAGGAPMGGAMPQPPTGK
jgi:hypothetical protein